jgi:hypothetical protein
MKYTGRAARAKTALFARRDEKPVEAKLRGCLITYKELGR